MFISKLLFIFLLLISTLNANNNPIQVIDKIDYTKIMVFFVVTFFILYRQYILKNINKKLSLKIDKKTGELKRLNKKLKNEISEKTVKLNDFIYSTTDFMWEVDITGKFTYLSDGVKNILGYTPEEMLGKTPFEFMKRFDEKKLLLELNNIIKTQNKIQNLESYLISKDNRNVCLVSNGVPIFDKSNQIKGYRGINKDITLQKNVQNDLKSKEALLLEQSKMASMGEMLESIAHQWRQPLCAITTAASGTKMQKELSLLTDELLNTNLDLIVKSANHLSTTIEEFRTFYEKDKEAKYFNINKSIQSSLELLSSKLYNSDIKVETDITDIYILGYENELIQVFMNILNNSINILEELEYKEKVIKIETLLDKDQILLHFLDNGGGMDENILDKVFDHKFTTKSEKNGTGIGLYMSKLIIKKSNGSIDASNTQFIYKNNTYKAACFTITLNR